MSHARTTFDDAIDDATALLQQFDAVHKDHPNTGEVMKRAGLVMALETCEIDVEDRITEAVTTRLKAVYGSPLGKFVTATSARNCAAPTTRRPKDAQAVPGLPRDRGQHRLEVAEPRPRQRTQDAGRLDRQARRLGAPRQAGDCRSTPCPSPPERRSPEKAIRFKGLTEAADHALDQD